MKALVIALALLAAPLSADITATITNAQAQAAGVADLDGSAARALAAHNTTVCASVGLPATCTNAQATAGGARGTVYATVNAWARSLLVDALLSRVDQITATDNAADCAAWRALTQAQRNAACSAAGRPNGCNLGCSRTATP